ncbi:Zinc metalloproteinase nas-4 [Parelaphostrongylus tenuis]|uniref:Zinc metalloproteinase nas-4 n=1 Tax=Parelaphostrongylus tenuis TaxID=148309 RepID=A0AAD5N6J8_PARTN|nr:Zinc metalloproteinase nas-4 [Parelaphostrongylus tenuis]
MEGDFAIENLRKFISDNNKLGRSAIREAYRKWPNREIPYTLSSQYGSYARSMIARAMKLAD